MKIERPAQPAPQAKVARTSRFKRGETTPGGADGLGIGVFASRHPSSGGEGSLSYRHH